MSNIPPVEQITIQFYPSSGDPSFKIDNWTSYSFESDFFVPADGFSFELADDRVEQLKNKIRIGDKVVLLIDDIFQCVGLIDKIKMSYDRSTGTILTISGRDKLGRVCDATTTPEIQSNIKANSTYQQIFQSIFNNFGLFDIKEDDDGIDAKASSGGKEGKAGKPSTGRKSRRKKSAQINYQLKPYKNEGYMEYALRLCHRNGWNIKLSVDGQSVLIFPPSYDRDTGIQYKLYHLLQDKDNLNNIKSGSLDVNWSKLPSVIIAEGLSGGGSFRKSSNKCVYVNDISGYDINGNPLSDGSGNPKTDLAALIKAYQSKGSQIITFNAKLKLSLPSAIFGVNTDLKIAPQAALFLYDQEAHGADELEFFTRKKMYEYQESFFTLHYVVDGHRNKASNDNSIWAINTLVNVQDETFGCNGQYWIKKRTFTKTRDGGTKTTLELKLPYIYDF